MNRLRMKRENIVFSMLMGIALMLPTGSSAQKGLFQRGVTAESYYDNCDMKQKNGIFGQRSSETIELTNVGVIDNQTFGEEVPLDSGIAVLLVTAMGYATLKRKEEKK